MAPRWPDTVPASPLLFWCHQAPRKDYGDRPSSWATATNWLKLRHRSTIDHRSNSEQGNPNVWAGGLSTRIDRLESKEPLCFLGPVMKPATNRIHAHFVSVHAFQCALDLGA